MTFNKITWFVIPVYLLDHHFIISPQVNSLTSLTVGFQSVTTMHTHPNPGGIDSKSLSISRNSSDTEHLPVVQSVPPSLQTVILVGSNHISRSFGPTTHHHSGSRFSNERRENHTYSIEVADAHVNNRRQCLISEQGFG